MREITFVFSGSFDPEQMLNTRNSPFNVATTVDTSDYDFSVEQVRTLAAAIGVAPVTDEVYGLTAGHPYLTNQLLSRASLGEGVEAAVGGMLRQRDSNLVHLGRRLAESGERCLELALRIRRGEVVPYAPGVDARLDQLMVMGLVKSDPDANVIIRCEIYNRYLDRMEAVRVSPPDVAPQRPDPLNFIPAGPLKEHLDSILELVPLLVSRNPAMATVFVGAILEGSLVVVLEGHAGLSRAVQAVNNEVSSGRLDRELRIGSPSQPDRWTLAQLIEVARHIGLITKPASQISHGIRDWRNLIHPAKYRKDYPQGMGIEVAEAALAVLHVLLREIAVNT